MQSDRIALIKVILAYAAVYIIWGTTYLFIRLAVDTMPALLMAGSRFIFASVIIYLYLRARGVPSPQRSHWPAGIIAGTLMLAGGSGLVHWAEQTVPIGTAAMVIATVPLFITFFDWLIYRNNWPGKKGITAYTYLLKTVIAAKAAMYSYANPVIAVFLGVLILDESLTPTMIAAMVIIVVAVFLITSRQPSRQPIDIVEAKSPLD